MTAKRVMAIGGAEDRENECEILKEFVRLAGGEDGEILIMTGATHEVSETVKEYRRVSGVWACRV